MGNINRPKLVIQLDFDMTMSVHERLGLIALHRRGILSSEVCTVDLISLYVTIHGKIQRKPEILNVLLL